MAQAKTPTLEGEVISPALFGGNFLADRYPLGTSGGIESQIDALGVTGLRYPGGSLTERLFDIRTPDAPRVTNDDGSEREFVPLSDFLDYAEAEGHAVTIVVPTRDNLSVRTDAAGDRFPAFSETDLRDFVRDVATGVYGDAEIEAFEIGNEYWGSGEMTAVEYGRLASRMADIIDDELLAVKLETGEDPGIDVIVQAGTNNAFSNLSDDYAGQPVDAVLDALNDRFDADFQAEDVVFFGGKINWRGVNDELVLREFSADEREAVDGVVTHIYSKESVSPGQRDFGLKQVERAWGEELPGVDIHVTEWNKSASDRRLADDEDFGLYQAHEILDVMESMITAGVDQAHVWPLVQNTRNALAPDAADGALSPAGEMFAMMSSSLRGKALLDFAPQDRDVTEVQTGEADIHGFYGDGELVFYLASTSPKVETTTFDLSGMVAGGSGIVSAKLLGVAEGDLPGSTDARAMVEDVPADEVYDNGTVVATLAPGEILELRIEDFDPTADFRTLMDQVDMPADLPPPDPRPEPVEDPDDPADVGLPALPAPEEDPDDDQSEPPADEDGGADGGLFESMGVLLLLLPVLALAGLAG
ncbi:hypothetical protein JANAI62_28290 [Jannaschia pagri]|uniref:Uncharacterized protein n=1 Tax=Jannaschia pagri TaxID=2829797 RepID=A0ABQ4NP87_9RHOB|nr:MULTISPECIES: hypothetical protein [unclassified Jannaschia]GIT92371.1 hypothetical protein JANAI61_28290 [Jannaschia sp. AI_61]GIT96206.1 hypothetical protein JANAI62_28290 [Jannaschia sp. AI_62]